jgi:hypothetical protein
MKTQRIVFSTLGFCLAMTLFILLTQRFELDIIVLAAFLPIGALYIGTLTSRYKPWVKTLITQPNSIIFGKYKNEEVYDLPADLLFNRVKELYEKDKKINVVLNEEKREILVVTGFSWITWGENIYIDVVENGEDSSTLNFCSVTFQMFSWGKNQENFENFQKQMEVALTV